MPLGAVPRESVEQFRETVVDAVTEGWRLVALFGMPETADGTRLLAVLADDAGGRLGVTSTLVGDRYPALTPVCPQAHAFEREIAEQCAVLPEGHPWLKPLRRHAPTTGQSAAPPPFSTPQRTRSSASRESKCTRWRSVPCTPASSSRATSASRPTVRRCCS